MALTHRNTTTHVDCTQEHPNMQPLFYLLLQVLWLSGHRRGTFDRFRGLRITGSKRGDALVVTIVSQLRKSFPSKVSDSTVKI